MGAARHEAGFRTTKRRSREEKMKTLLPRFFSGIKRSTHQTYLGDVGLSSGRAMWFFSKGYILLSVLFLLPVCADSSWAKTVTCEGGPLIQKEEDKGADLEVIGECTVSEGETYYYGNVNVWGGGSLEFEDPAPGKEIHFWAKSILVETDSSLIIGTPDLPIGDTCQAARANGEAVYCGRLITIHLYGEALNTFPFGTNPGMGAQGITCKSDNMCGVPEEKWTSNGGKKFKDLPGGVEDYFYAYTPQFGFFPNLPSSGS